jgi:hypothetical protein
VYLQDGRRLDSILSVMYRTSHLVHLVPISGASERTLLSNTRHWPVKLALLVCERRRCATGLSDPPRTHINPLVRWSLWGKACGRGWAASVALQVEVLQVGSRVSWEDFPGWKPGLLGVLSGLPLVGEPVHILSFDVRTIKPMVDPSGWYVEALAGQVNPTKFSGFDVRGPN